MRRTYVYDEKLKKLVPKEEFQRELGVLVMPDLEDFVSPVDGRIVHGRAGLRLHDKELGTTNVADFKDHWENFAKKREKLMTGQDNDPKRTEAVVRAYHKLEGRSW